MALALSVRNSPVDGVVLLASLHGLAVAGWAILLRRIDPRAGRLAGWALAVHPLSVASGAAFWNPSLILPTTLLFVWGIERWVEASSEKGLALACVGAALMLQAHLTTALLLPLFATGWRRKAPIGWAGLAGLGAAVLILAPMAARDLLALTVNFHSVIHDAGHGGGGPSASYPLALLRAVTLEGVIDRMAPAGRGVLRAWLLPAVGAWMALAAAGAVVLARTAQGFRRTLLLVGLAVPVAAVPLLHVGALFYYLDLTLPLRCWLFAAGVGLAARFVGRVAAAVAVAVVLVLPVVYTIDTRATARRDGFVRTAVAASDLRMPWGAAAGPVGIPTLGSARAVGGALEHAGLSLRDARSALRGPWQAAMGAAVRPWLAPGDEPRSVPRAANRPAAPQGRALLLLQADEQIAHPATPPQAAGSFLLYAFTDEGVTSGATPRLTMHLTGRDAAAPVAIQLVAEPGPGAPRVEVSGGVMVPMTRADSQAGVQVWSAILDHPVGTVDVVRDGAPERGLFGPPIFAAYAFSP